MGIFGWVFYCQPCGQEEEYYGNIADMGGAASSADDVLGRGSGRIKGLPLIPGMDPEDRVENAGDAASRPSIPGLDFQVRRANQVCVAHHSFRRVADLRINKNADPDPSFSLQCGSGSSFSLQCGSGSSFSLQCGSGSSFSL